MSIEHPYSFIVLCLLLASCMLAAPFIASIFDKKPPQSVTALTFWLMLLFAITLLFGLWAAVSVGFDVWQGLAGGALVGAWLIAKFLEIALWKHFRV